MSGKVAPSEAADGAALDSEVLRGSAENIEVPGSGGGAEGPRKPLICIDTPSMGAKTPYTSRHRDWGFAQSRRTPVGLQSDGEAEIHNIYLMTVWAALTAPRSWKAAGVVLFGITLMLLQMVVLLNLAWILNDARLQDLEDNYENYAVFNKTEFLRTGETRRQPIAHKHIVSQDDRYCRPSSSGASDPIYYMYYNCLLEGSMTFWDISTLILMCLAMFEKVSDSSLELVFQIVLASVGIVQDDMSIYRRFFVVALMTARILQETLFLAISVTIVAAAKGTLNMILNSLAISFFADLDNIVWDRLLILTPSLEPLKQQAEGDLAGQYAGVTQRVQGSKLLSMRYAAAATLIYFFSTILLKDQTVYLYLTHQSAPDTNLAAGLFIMQLFVMFALLLLVCSAIGESVLAVSRGDAVLPTFWASTLRPGKMHLILLHTLSTAVPLLFYAIGLVEGVIGASCSWRFVIIYAAIMTAPVVLNHALMEFRLHTRSAPLRRACATVVTLLSLLVFAFALFVTVSPTQSSYSDSFTGEYADPAQVASNVCSDQEGNLNYRCVLDEALMSQYEAFKTYCRCGYDAWEPDSAVLLLNKAFCAEAIKDSYLYQEFQADDDDGSDAGE